MIQEVVLLDVEEFDGAPRSADWILFERKRGACHISRHSAATAMLEAGADVG